MGRTRRGRCHGRLEQYAQKSKYRFFYMDETEVRNIDWLEYLSLGLRRVYSPIPKYIKRHYPIPHGCGVTSWVTTNRWWKNYLRFPAYAEYPVVGVSCWEQATDYCVWRTDRVNEQSDRQKSWPMILIIKKMKITSIRGSLYDRTIYRYGKKELQGPE